MKHVIISYVLCFLSLAFSVSSSKRTDLPDEGLLKWNIDPNDMLRNEQTQDPVEENIAERVFKAEPISSDHQFNTSTKYVQTGKKCNAFEKQAEQYMKRYISLFLVKCGLQDIPESDENMRLDLEFFITIEDLLFLQNLSKGVNIHKVQDVLQRLDAIFESGFQLKGKNLNEITWSFVDRLVGYISGLSSKTVSYVFVAFVILLVALVISCRVKLSKLVIVSALLNIFILLEGIFDYQNKRKEAETEDHVNMLKVKDFSDACDRNKKSLWSSVTALFNGDDCLNYHMAFVKSRAEEVSPLECIMDAYNRYIFHFLSKVLGSSIRVFSENINESMPFPWFWYVGTNLAILVFIFILIFSLLKPSIRFSFFGVSLDVGFSERSRDLQTNDLGRIHDHRIQEIERNELMEDTEMRMERQNEDGSHLKAAEDSSSDKTFENNGGKFHLREAEDKKDGNLVDVSEGEGQLINICTVEKTVNAIKKTE